MPENVDRRIGRLSVFISVRWSFIRFGWNPHPDLILSFDWIWIWVRGVENYTARARMEK